MPNSIKRLLKVAAAALAVTLIVFAVLPTAPSAAAPGSLEVVIDHDNNPATPSVREFAGATRYETSLALAQRFANNRRAAGIPIREAIVASGESLVDAATAAAFSGAIGAPILLTPTHSLFPPAAHLIEREGVTDVWIVGGEAAVSRQVETALRRVNGVISVERIAGSNRFETAALIAGAATGATRSRNAPAYGTLCDDGLPAVVIVSGDDHNLQDVIVAGPLAWAPEVPILLVSGNTLPIPVEAALSVFETKHVLRLGSGAAVSETTLRRAGATKITTIDGGNPYATSVAFLDYSRECLDGSFSDRQIFELDSRSVALISASALADGISASPVLGGGLHNFGFLTPVLLVERNAFPAEIGDYLRSTPNPIQITAIGGAGAISHEVANAAVVSANGGIPTVPTSTPRVPVDVVACRMIGINDPSTNFGRQGRNTTAGFPLPRWAPATTGRFRVAVLFVDFPNAPATYGVDREAGGQLEQMERYLETSSYGKLDVQVDVLPIWLRMGSNWQQYLGESSAGTLNLLPKSLSPEAVALADPHFDFSREYDALMIVAPSSYFSGGIAHFSSFFTSADGANLSRFSIINSKANDELSETPDEWWLIAAHELAHNLGLADLYPYDNTVDDPPSTVIPDHTWVEVEIGLMGLTGYLSVSDSNENYQRVSSLPDRWTWRANDQPIFRQTLPHFQASEMLAWSRWQLGWLDDNRVHCLSNPDTFGDIVLSPVTSPTGTALIVFPFSESEAMVVEARRFLGYDARNIYHRPCCEGQASRHEEPNLISEGAFVYYVNAQGENGELPISMSSGIPSDNLVLESYPNVGVGWYFTQSFLNGTELRVKVERDEGQSFVVRISLD